MKVVIQRVSRAAVTVHDRVVGEIAHGLVVLVGVVRGDTRRDMIALTEKILALRIFADADGKMNLSVQDVNGSILLVSQFTLAADCRKGRRPSFVDAAAPVEAQALYETMAAYLRDSGIAVQTGVFGAQMAVALVNDGPVTILLNSREL